MSNNPRNSFLILLLASALSMVSYWIYSISYYGSGFPLDDAWIHQTYARNLANGNGFVFSPGVPSAGSTSPGWSILLAIGYILNLPPTLWSGLLSCIALAGVAMIVNLFATKEIPKLWIRFPSVGLILAFEWHLAWAALSGMETLLFTLVVCVVLLLPFFIKMNSIVVGMLGAAAIWVRPDGLTLLPPILLITLVKTQGLKQSISEFGKVLAGFLILLLPYLFLNNNLTGSIWPNTFYAKQEEYSILLQKPLIERIFTMTSQPLIGIGIVLLPGFLWFIWSSIRSRERIGLIGLAWLGGFLILYTLRLPVTYQHARYLIPAMPIYWTFGFIGTVRLLTAIEQRRIAWIISRAVTIIAIVVLMAFWGLGMNAFAQDVAIIETEMVKTARWVSDQVPSDEILATHDIGAMGYFGQHEILDLAGLVNPEVIPFLRDENRIQTFLQNRDIHYLVTFPGWYPYLATQGEQIYQTGSRYSPLSGGENMSVYKLDGNTIMD